MKQKQLDLVTRFSLFALLLAFLCSSRAFAEPVPLAANPVKGPAGVNLKAEVKDVNGVIADYILKLDGTLKNFVLTLTGDNVPPDFAYAHQRDRSFRGPPLGLNLRKRN